MPQHDEFLGNHYNPLQTGRTRNGPVCAKTNPNCFVATALKERLIVFVLEVIEDIVKGSLHRAFAENPRQNQFQS
jgi:hypothetical protein